MKCSIEKQFLAIFLLPFQGDSDAFSLYQHLEPIKGGQVIPHCDNYHEGRHCLDQSLCQLNGPILPV